MLLEIKNDKQFEHRRGVAWSCELWVDGKKAAEAEDEGNGGMIWVRWTDQNLKNKVRAYANKNPISMHVGVHGTWTVDGKGQEWDGNYILALATNQ